MRKNCLKYAITGTACSIFAVLFCILRDFGQMSALVRYRTLCDAFTVPGLLCICVALLLWAANDGVFYGVGYCLDVTCKALLPGGRKKLQRYYDYVQHRKEKKITGYGFLYACGGVCMAIALVFLLLFYSAF